MTTVRRADLPIGFWFDVFLRVFLAVLFVTLEKTEPFVRKIHDDELWLYRNPRTDPYISTTILWPLVFITPIAVLVLTFFIYKDRTEFCQGTLAVTLTLGLNGALTDMIKIIVVAFASFGFIALYLAGKLKTFGSMGKGQAWKLCAFIIPLAVALSIALSRTCDYHHHWQDVAVGSSIGLSLAYICYRHYYPPLDSIMSHRPYSAVSLRQSEVEMPKGVREEQVKWI